MSLTQHLPLLDTPSDVPPWQADEDHLTAQVLTVPQCPQCLEIEAQRQAILGLVTQANTLAPTLVQLEKAMLHLQGELRVIRSELSRSVRSLRQGIIAHRRCTVCGILVGPEHVVVDLIKEPNGPAFVCHACAHTLQVTRQTAREARDNDNDD